MDIGEQKRVIQVEPEPLTAPAGPPAAEPELQPLPAPIAPAESEPVPVPVHR